MFQLPKLKYIKPHNTRLKFKSVLIKKIQYKHFFLAATSNFIYFNQIEACRKILRKKLGKKSKILIHVFTFTPYSFKPKETRMGRGKGNNFKWCKQVQSGKVLFNLLPSIWLTCSLFSGFSIKVSATNRCNAYVLL